MSPMASPGHKFVLFYKQSVERNLKLLIEVERMATIIQSYFSFSPSHCPTLTASNFFSSSSSCPKFKVLVFGKSGSSYYAGSSIKMEAQEEGRRRFMEFPFVSGPHRDLMVDLVSTVETRLGSQLRPCTLPQNVQFYQNQTGSAQASLQIRSGDKSSPIDFTLGSWLHCELPSGGALNITSLSGYLRHSTDAPNFLFELIQSTPTSFVLILDLPPRKDLVLHPDYLKNFYEETQLDKYRQQLEKLDEVQPYVSSSLYIRSVVSPTAILVRVETKEGGRERLEEIIEKDVHCVLREVVGVWLDKCACGEREVEETERAILKKRDQLIKNQTIEIDLGSSFPRLFGEETASRVLRAIRGVFNS